MKIRAAVLEEFGQPLVVQELDLAEPKDREVLVRLAACGVCHTDLYTASGADPSGYTPCVLGHEGAGVVERVGPGVTLVAARRPRHHALRARSAGSASTAVSGRTNRCVAIRDMQGLGFLPDGTTRLSRDGEPMRHFMGTSTFAEYTVMPEIALAKVSPDASLEGCAPFACGLATGIGAALYTARRPARARRARCSAAASSGSARSSGAGSRAPSGSSRSTSPRAGSRARATTAPPTRASRGTTSSLASRGDRRLRRRLHVRGDRERAGDARRPSRPRARRGGSRR